MKILFLDSTKGFEPGRIKTKPTGGIVGSLTILPRLLSSFGHEVYVACPNLKEQEVDGVTYSNFARCVVPDVVVFNRSIISRQVASIFDCPKVWWLHDICDPRYLEDDGYTEADLVVALSRYCQKTYEHFYEVPEDRFTVIPNGVDRAVFYADNRERNRSLYICASAPIKGLQPIEYVFENLRRLDPNMELRVYSSQKLHDFEDDDRIKKMLDRFRSKGITVLDPIPQDELAEVMRQAWCLLMPNHYPEICSNLLLQAQACGLPVVATGIGSVPEFIIHGGTGLYTKWLPDSPFNWWKEFTEQAMSLWINRAKHRLISKSSTFAPLSWEQIAKEWDKALCQLRSTSRFQKTQTLAI